MLKEKLAFSSMIILLMANLLMLQFNVQPAETSKDTPHIRHNTNTEFHPRDDAWQTNYGEDSTGLNTTWFKTIGEQTDDTAYCIAVNSDNVYIAGTSSGAGGYDAFVASLTASNGSLQWFKTIEGTEEDVVVATDADEDSIYITGYTGSHGAGAIDAFAASFSASNGKIQWFSTIGGTGNDWADSIVIDEDSIYITGRTYSFGAGDLDAFAASLSASNGKLKWFKTIGGSGWDDARGIAVNGESIYITGCTGSFGAGDPEAFVASLTASDGDLQWFRTIGGNDEDYGWSIAVDDNSIYTTGYTKSYGAGGIDAFVASLSASNGKLKWFKTIGGTGNDYGWNVAAHEDNVYMTGGDGVYIACLALNGSLEWFRTIGGPSDDSAFGMVIDEGSIYITGDTYSFGAGGSDAFVAKLLLDYISSDDPEDMNWSANETWTQISVVRSDPTATDATPTVESQSPSVQTHTPTTATLTPASSPREPEIHTAYPGYFDLAIEGIEVSDLRPSEGKPVTIEVSVKNLGNIASSRGTLILRCNVSYTHPIERKHLLPEWTAKTFDPIPPNSSTLVELLWNATEIVNDKAISSLCLEIISDEDMNQADNKAHITNIRLLDTSRFDICTDSYSFSNWEATECEKGIAKEDLKAHVSLLLEQLFPFMQEPVRDAVSSYITCTSGDFCMKGYCYGMATTASKYHAGLLPKPVDKETFQMLLNETMADIESQQAEGIWLGLDFQQRATSGVNLRDEFAAIVDLLNEGIPPVLTIEADDKQKLDGQHVVTVYGTYSVSDDIKHLAVYDSDYPGIGIIYTLDLKNNKAYSQTYGTITATANSPSPQLDRMKMIIKGILESTLKMFKGILIFQSPVNVTITDQHGRIISEDRSEISGARMEYYNLTKAKVFYLPLDLTYTVYIDSCDEGNCTVTSIMPLSKNSATFTEFSFNITEETKAQFSLQPGQTEYVLQVDEDGDGTFDQELQHSASLYQLLIHGVSVVSVAPSSNQVLQADSIDIDVVVANEGTEKETFDVSTFYDSNIVGTQTISLNPGVNTTLTFTWDTTDVAPGDYPIKAEASVVPEETDTKDNIKTFDGTIEVSGPSPPWWQTWWPLLAVAVIIVVAVIFLVTRSEEL